ncbi:MAG: DUF2066 domain-containing protein [Alphaproteobacteria bacterium]|nr:DUF2066 domain-containing protein [Alphaproteobacteria bacterium]
MSKISVFLILLFVFAVLGIVPGVGRAAAQQTALDDVFVVRDIKIDETAASASMARSSAIEKGQREALERLIARLTRRVFRGRIGEIDQETMQFLISALRIDNERTSDIRYLANLTVIFKSDAVRNYLRTANIPFAEVRSRPILIIPVIEQRAAYALWENPNPWRDAWLNLPSNPGLVPVVAPIGDLSDYAGLTADQAVEADVGALSEMSNRYGAGSAMVAIATIDETRLGFLQVQITAARVGRHDEKPLLVTLQALPEEPLEGLFDRAVAAVVGALDDDWKSNNSVSFGQAERLHAAVPIQNLRSWIEVRGRLENVPTVRQVRLLALTLNSAEIEVDYFGDERRLSRALDRFDLVLEASGFGKGGVLNVVVSPAVPTHVVRLSKVR